MKLRSLLRHPWLGPLIALVLVYVVFVVLRPETFGRSANLVTMLRQTVVVGIAAVGMTMIIITGGIDLSVGSQVALTTVVVALMLKGDSGPWTASFVGVGTSAAAGFVTGLLIVALRVHPFIVTLGTMGILRGVASGLAKQQKIDAPAKGLDDLLAVLPPAKSWMLVPAGVWTFLAVALLIAFVLRFTPFGRHVFAVGSNEQTARLCGVRVPWVKVAVYTLAGLLAGVAGVMEFGTLTVGDPTDSLGLELDVIAAVVIGGGALSGGEGSILGSLIGAFLMTVIKTGAVYVGLPSWVQLIITGVIIVLAVAADQIRHRRA